MIDLTSSSICFAVSSEKILFFEPADLPRNGFSSSSSYFSVPNLSEKPHFVTIFLAKSVALSISLEAPVVIPSLPLIISSATLPPKRLVIWLIRAVFE